MNLTYKVFHIWVSTILIVVSSGAKILALTGKLASIDSTSTSTQVEKLTPITPLDTRCWNLRVGNLHKIELTKSTFLILGAGLALIRRDDVPKPGEFISRCRGLHQMHQPRTATQIFRSSCRSSYQIRKLSWLAFLLLMQHWYYLLYYTLANRKGRKLPMRSALVVQTRIKTLWEGAEAWQRQTSYDKPPGYQMRHHFASILTGGGCNFLHFASRNDTTSQHLGEQFWNHARTHCYCKQGSGGTASCGKVFWYRSCTCQTSQVVVTSRKRTYTV